MRQGDLGVVKMIDRKRLTKALSAYNEVHAAADPRFDAIDTNNDGVKMLHFMLFSDGVLSGDFERRVRCCQSQSTSVEARLTFSCQRAVAASDWSVWLTKAVDTGL